MRGALVLLLLASAAFGQAAAPSPATGSSSITATNATVAGVALVTTAALNLYVDPAGNDGNACTSTGTGACLTIQAAFDKIPKLVRHPVIVTVAAGANYTGAYLTGITVDHAATQVLGAFVVVQGTMAASTLATGANSGTLTSGTAGSSTSTTWGTATLTGATWTVNDLRGRWLAITGGTGAGQIKLITDNTATVITIGGGWAVAPGGTSTFEIREPSSKIHTASLAPLFKATGWTDTLTVVGGTPGAEGPAGFYAFGLSGENGTTGSAPFTFKFFDFDNGTTSGNSAFELGSPNAKFLIQANKQSSTSGGASLVADSGGGFVDIRDNFSAGSTLYGAVTGVSVGRAQLRGNMTTGVSSTNSPIISAASGGIQVTDQAGRYLMGGSANALYYNGTVRLPANFILQGIRADCATVGNFIIAPSTSSINSAVLGVDMIGSQIDNCVTVFNTRGPSMIALIDVAGTGNTTVFKLEKGAAGKIASTTTITGTTEVNLDGTTSTFATLRGLTPKQTILATTNSTIMEVP